MATSPDRETKIRHDTFTRSGKPITVLVDQKGRETEIGREVDKVDPHQLGRTQDRRLGR